MGLELFALCKGGATLQYHYQLGNNMSDIDWEQLIYPFPFIAGSILSPNLACKPLLTKSIPSVCFKSFRTVLCTCLGVVAASFPKTYLLNSSCLIMSLKLNHNTAKI